MDLFANALVLQPTMAAIRLLSFLLPVRRYKYDNIIAQDLDLPERTTQEYEGPSMVGGWGINVGCF